MVSFFWVFTALCIYISSNASPIDTNFSSKTIYTLNSTQQLNDGETLLSSNNRFELGFFCPSNPCKDVKFLGIWYKNMSPLTVIWVANRKRPIRRPSSDVHLVLNDSGVLIIQDGSKRVLWRNGLNRYSPSSNARKPLLQLLDSGNLVVQICDNSTCNGRYIFESFELPGDTLLPGMELSFDYGSKVKYREITSWRKKDDPSNGDFKFGFDRLVQAPQLVLSKENGVRLSRWGPWDGQKFSGMNSLMNNPVLSPILTFHQDEVSFKFSVLNKSSLLRFVLSPFGSLQFLWWKSESEGWITILTLNKDNCDRIGSCGSYGICYSDDPSCRCLEQGFMAISSVDWCGFECSSGCKRKIDLNCTEGDGFFKYERMKLPDNSTIWGALSLDECDKKCSKQCNCMAYASLNMYGNGSTCVVWFDDLVDLRVIHGGGNDLYIRMSNIELESIRHKKRKKVVIFVVMVLLSTASCALLLIILRCICISKRSKRRASIREHNPLTEFGSQEDDSDCHFFVLDEIITATNNFSSFNEIGIGGFGRVYKGELARGEEVAVKRLAESSWQGIREFKNEVTLIAKLQHRNLVKLFGYCIDGNERILVYEYLPNHSLDHIIFDQVKKRLLMWDDRFKIIKGVAKGLVYLHDDSRLRVIHRDLKTSNILLDKEMNPKISDFGLARILASEKEETTNRVIGTHGYMSPEYIMNGHFSTKSDVYSFGVLVLEIISGKKNWGFHHPDHNLNLLGHAWKLWISGRPLELIDPILVESTVQEDEVVKCIHIGLLCVQKQPEDRPTMSEVVNIQQNENFVSMRQPDEPGFYAGRSLIGMGFSTAERDLDSVNEVTMTTITGR